MADPQSNAALSAHPAVLTLPEGAPRSGVIHVRHRHAENYTVVGNHLAQHGGLSAAAIGLAVYIQSLPDGVSVTGKALALRFREGERAIRRAMNELEEAGYLARPRVDLGRGKFATRTFAFDHPGAAPEAYGSEAEQDHEPVPAPQPVPAAQPVAGPDPDDDPDPDPAPPPPGRPRDQAPPAPPASPPPAPPARPRPAAPPRRPVGPAAELLARLRLADPRLLLSARDVERLATAVDTWIGRGATPAQITRTLTVSLPPAFVPIHHPARFLAYRLTTHLPPPLPAEPPPPPGPAPLVTCDGCERAFRSHDPDAHCAECRATGRPAA
ncbi:hypothetical protein ACIGBL_22620 [Streptomyces sp. NPDC085614]|uniref:hypothetical protein n=1 Tax=Streptomyces sp. NPDC085614 TaxID=3365733 RepID=UPI0037CF375F